MAETIRTNISLYTFSSNSVKVATLPNEWTTPSDSQDILKEVLNQFERTDFTGPYFTSNFALEVLKKKAPAVNLIFHE